MILKHEQILPFWIDQLVERFNQLELRTSNNWDDLSMIDQLRATSDSQFSSFTNQLQVLSEFSNTPQPPPFPTLSVEVVDAEHTVGMQGLRGKVKGLEQTIIAEHNAVLGLRDMVIDLSECMDSSLSTAVTSRPASGPVLEDRLNSTREHDVVR